MPDNEKTAGMLLDELAALDPAQRRQVAEELSQVSDVARHGDGTGWSWV
jgi:hypothetical protein